MSGANFGDIELKNAWVVRHDGLLFGSGWYIDGDEFTMDLVSLSVDKYRELGLAGTMAYFAGPESALAGLDVAIAYYNAAETVDGRWFAFIGGPDGKIAGHSDPSMIGRQVRDLFGGETFEAAGDGGWGGVRVAAGSSSPAPTAMSSAPAGAGSGRAAERHQGTRRSWRSGLLPVMGCQPTSDRRARTRRSAAWLPCRNASW